MRLGSAEIVFINILSQRNYARLRNIFEEYQRVTGHNFETAVNSVFSGDAKEGFLALVRFIKNPAEYFASRLHQSMDGLGTNDEQLIRLVVLRSEIDMPDIKSAYLDKYGNSLEDAISVSYFK